MLAALWDLVWAGEVTNDSLAPVRAKVAGGTSRRASGARSRRSAPQIRRLSRQGPPAGSGRWSLTAPLFGEPGRTPSTTEAATARALQLLERYGVLTREMALAEGAEGGFAGVYPVLKLLEERGQVRRGYFIDGLGAAQFAQAGAVDRLRAAGRPLDEPATDVERLALGARARHRGARPLGARCHRSGPTVRRRAAVARIERSPGPGGGRLRRAHRRRRVRAPREGRPSDPRPSPPRPTIPSGRRCWPVWWARGGPGGSRSNRSTVSRPPRSPWADNLRESGFSEGYKGLTYGR